MGCKLGSNGSWHGGWQGSSQKRGMPGSIRPHIDARIWLPREAVDGIFCRERGRVCLDTTGPPVKSQPPGMVATARTRP